MAQRLRNGVVKHGLLMGTPEAPRIFFMVLRQDFQKMEAQPPGTTDHDAGRTWCMNERNESGRLMQRLRRRPVYPTTQRIQPKTSS